MPDLPHVLIVDDSRVGRVSLGQVLKTDFSLREEADGEAAWQVLLDDASIVAVISDVQMPKLDGYGLLERVRSSQLPRLQGLPFILVSGEETDKERARAQEMGVSDFVTKGGDRREVLVRLKSLLALAQSGELGQAIRPQLVQDPESGLFSRSYLQTQAEQLMSYARRQGSDLSVLAVGFDGYTKLCLRLGSAAGAAVCERFARMLAGKMRREDVLGHFGEGTFAVLSPGTAPAYCASFAERVRQAVEVARVTAHGEAVGVTLSIGLASYPVDQSSDAAALLALAEQRMRVAMRRGGNQCETGGALPAVRPLSVHHAIELLAANRPGAVMPHLPALGQQIMPLLALINEEFGWSLPLAEMARSLKERQSDNH